MIRCSVAVLIALLSLPVSGATERRLDGGPQPIMVRPAGPVVTIDVKDAEAVVILKQLQKQCGVRNLMIDPNVKGTGTFYFHEVPCRQAWSMVLRSMGFHWATYPSSVITVSTQKTPTTQKTP